MNIKYGRLITRIKIHAWDTLKLNKYHQYRHKLLNNSVKFSINFQVSISHCTRKNDSEPSSVDNCIFSLALQNYQNQVKKIPAKCPHQTYKKLIKKSVTDKFRDFLVPLVILISMVVALNFQVLLSRDIVTDSSPIIHVIHQQ